MSDEAEYRDLAPLGFPGYRVGDDGSVWSCLKCPKQRAAAGVWRKLQLASHKKGYLRATLSVNKASHPRQVQRLVLLAFVGPCPDGMEACHRDGNGRNNALSNLRWDTHLANMRDAVRHGSLSAGGFNSRTKLTAEQVRAIIADLATGMGFRETGRRYGVAHHTIRLIANRRTWSRVWAEVDAATTG